MDQLWDLTEYDCSTHPIDHPVKFKSDRLLVSIAVSKVELLPEELLLLFSAAVFYLAWGLGLGAMIQWLAKFSLRFSANWFLLNRLKWEVFIMVLVLSASTAALTHELFRHGIVIYAVSLTPQPASVVHMRSQPLELRFDRDLDALAARLAAAGR
jgi:hypothetical protein